MRRFEGVVVITTIYLMSTRCSEGNGLGEGWWQAGEKVDGDGSGMTRFIEAEQGAGDKRGLQVIDFVLAWAL
jgi:hypothetical protein